MSHEKTKTNINWFLQLSRILSVAEAWPTSLLCVIEPWKNSSQIENTSVSHSAALGDVFLRYKYHGRWSLFWVPPTYADVNTHRDIKCVWSRQKSLQQMHYLLKSESNRTWQN